jgi:hypothetical protein
MCGTGGCNQAKETGRNKSVLFTEDMSEQARRLYAPVLMTNLKEKVKKGARFMAAKE